MHIGFLTLEYPPVGSGGIGTSIRNLARALVEEGHRVTVIGWGREAQFDDQGVAVQFASARFVPMTGWLVSRLAIQRRLRRLVDDEGLEIVEAHDWCGLSAGIRPNCPLVIRCHGSAVYFGHLLGERVRPSVRLAERVALRGADAVAAVSRFAAAETARLFSLTDSVAVLPNGIDCSQFAPARPEEIEPKLIVYTGTIVRKKGVLDLCRAFNHVVAQVPDARLLIVGRDSSDKMTGSPSTWKLCLDELSDSARSRVEYLGQKPYDEVQLVMRRAAVCVFPSHAEALPLAWLEAMACGKPIVAYDIGWAPEIVRDSVTGFLVPESDVVTLATRTAQLLSDPRLAFSMGATARAVVEAEFESQVAARLSLRWYHDALDAHAPGSGRTRT